MGFEIGSSVDCYRLIGYVGSGGMGDVFKVEHVVTRRIEAMKVLANGRLRTGGQAERFLREITVQASLNHPNIAAVHNAFWVNDDLVMVMELVEGCSLRDVLRAGRIPLAAGIDYAEQVLRALSYAHSQGVIHRDITPANIIITPGGQVKLTDFGLAKTRANHRLTETGIAIGSAYYMSPEQVKGSLALDARTDIYSLGVVLYEVVTGRKPFEAGDTFSLMLAHVGETPAPPAEIDPDVPPELSEIVLTALAKDPEKRFQSAEQFRGALQRIKQDKTAATRPESNIQPAAQLKLGSRRRAPVYAGAAALLLLSGVLLWKNAPSTPEQSRKAAATPAQVQPVPAAVKPSEQKQQTPPIPSSPAAKPIPAAKTPSSEPPAPQTVKPAMEATVHDAKEGSLPAPPNKQEGATIYVAEESPLSSGAKKESERLAECGGVLEEILNIPDGIPRQLLDRAECVAVIPSVKKFAIGFGGSYGRGALVCRSGEDLSGPWGPPAMMRLEGGNFGLQLGAQATDFVLLVMNSKGASSLLNSKVKLGADASVAAGPKGRTVAAATDAHLRAQILSYSRSRGLFAGVSLEGSTLRPDQKSNEKLYGRDITAREIVHGAKVPVPAAGDRLVGILRKASQRNRSELVVAEKR